MTGELVSLAVAILWTASAVFFEYAGHRIKAMDLNLIRLAFAAILIGAILMCMSGNPLPILADTKTWIWMSISGFVGFVFGDFFLFSSYRLIPARFTQLIMTLAPAFAAIAGWFILGEKLSATALLGMIVTITGIAISILKRGSKKEQPKVEIATPFAANYTIITKPAIEERHRNNAMDNISAAARKTFSGMKNALHVELPARGLFFAFLASVGQGVGLVLSKQGMQFYEEAVTAAAGATGSAGAMATASDIALGADAMSAAASSAIASSLYIPLAATQMRILTGIVCFVVIIALMRSFGSLFSAFKEHKHIAAAFGGAVVGPVLGVTLSLLAVQHTNTAVASTIMALTPIIILLPDRVIYKRRVHFIEVLGAVISVVGVALFFI